MAIDPSLTAIVAGRQRAKAIRKRPPTFFPAVPPIYERLLTAAHKDGVSLSGIQIGISGAMPLAQSLVEPWEKETGGYLVEAYRLSETSPG
jgi:long-chain acyl-CoA synthetase